MKKRSLFWTPTIRKQSKKPLKYWLNRSRTFKWIISSNSSPRSRRILYLLFIILPERKEIKRENCIFTEAICQKVRKHSNQHRSLSLSLKYCLLLLYFTLLLPQRSQKYQCYFYFNNNQSLSDAKLNKVLINSTGFTHYCLNFFEYLDLKILFSKLN